MIASKPSGPGYFVLIIMLDGPLLWSRGNIFTSHAAGPGSISSRVYFLFEIFPVFSLNPMRNVGHIRHGYHMAIMYHQCTDGDGL